MRTSFLAKAVIVVGAVMIVGCASTASQETDKPAPGSTPAPIKKSDDPAATKPSTGGSRADAGCGASLLLYNAGKGKIAGDELAVYADRSKTEKSLCEVLKATGKKAAIFQFAGVECLSCQDEAKDIQAKLKADPKGKDVAHVLVMTDFFKDYEDADFKDFAAKYAPGAVQVFDEARLWKYFAADASAPDRATIMAMNLEMSAVVFNKEGQQSGIIQAALDLAGE